MIVKAMLERTQVDLEARDEDDWTPLHWATEKGHLPVVLYLCEPGADKDARGAFNMAPLHWAAREGHLAAVQYFDGLK